MLKKVAVESAAEAYLELLASRGVEYFFGNAGTDFAPIIEAYAKRAAQGQVLPRAITVAARDHRHRHGPRLRHGHRPAPGGDGPRDRGHRQRAGRHHQRRPLQRADPGHAPGARRITEDELLGGRNRHIHWAQESFDQGAMVREFVKWDYELRMGGQLETVVDRALAIARSEPQGPVYLTLPREVLAEQPTPSNTSSRRGWARPRPPSRTRPPSSAPPRSSPRRRNPIIIAKSSGRDPRRWRRWWRWPRRSASRSSTRPPPT